MHWNSDIPKESTEGRPHREPRPSSRDAAFPNPSRTRSRSISPWFATS